MTCVTEMLGSVDPSVLQALAVVGAVFLAKSAICMLAGFYATFLRPGKNLKQYGAWAVVTGATGKTATAVPLRKRRTGCILCRPFSFDLFGKEHTHPGNEIRLLLLQGWPACMYDMCIWCMFIDSSVGSRWIDNKLLTFRAAHAPRPADMNVLLVQQV